MCTKQTVLSSKDWGGIGSTLFHSDNRTRKSVPCEGENDRLLKQLHKILVENN